MPLTQISSDRNTLFGFAKYPYKRETPVPTAYDWLNAKQIDDNIGSLQLWRIHSKLYDFQHFDHPGGKVFIELCKGTDVTELFECSHVNIDRARSCLQKYFVRNEVKPRNTATFTFLENGFYSTIRKRAWKILSSHDTKPSHEILLTHDCLLMMFMLLMIFANSLPYFDQIWMYFECAAGLTLALLANCAHNFFHKKNNWRMYSFDLTTHSSHEWRITHAYSHHMFPNTINDYEITAFEPFVQYLPRASKGFLSQTFTAVCMIVIFGLGMVMVALKRLLLILTGQRAGRWEHSLPFLMTLLLIVVRLTVVSCTRGLGVSEVFGDEVLLTNDLLWQIIQVVLYRVTVMYCVCSFCFLHISLSAGHHHPDIWHAGDVVYPASSGELADAVRDDDNKADLEETVDWGIFQLISVGRRPTIDSSVPMAAVSFGLHQLHHLFPTVDHSKLPLLQDLLRETCREFKFDIFAVDAKSNDKATLWGEKRSFSIVDGWTGMVRQAMRSKISTSNFPDFIQEK